MGGPTRPGGRNRRRKKKPPPRPQQVATPFPDATRSNLTIEGRIEALGDFARGANSSRRKQRLVRIMLLAFALSFLGLAVLGAVVSAIYD